MVTVVRIKLWPPVDSKINQNTRMRSDKRPKTEFWLQDILAPNEFNSLGRGIAASCSHLSFCWETPGTIALYPLEKVGRLLPPYSLLHAHSAPVTDMEFSPFFDGILATAGEDKQVLIIVF